MAAKTSSRNDMFLKCIDEYFNNTVLMYQGYYDFEWNITKQKMENPRGNIHEYELHIPQNILLYVVEEHMNPHGVRIEKENVYRYQKIPEIIKIVADFDNYFRSYDLIKDGVRESFVDIDRLANMEDGGLKVVIIVKYAKKYIPFPHTASYINHEYVERKIRGIDIELLDYSDKLEDACEEIYHLKQKNNKLKNTLNKNEKHMYGIMNLMYRFYAESANREECPVCYETIKPEMLIILDCSHLLCGECCEKCTKCPICRDIF
jgi:hypothetical protein